MTRVLAINAEIREAIAKLMAEAKRNPISLDFIKAQAMPDKDDITLKDRKPGFERPPSSHISIPYGYRAAYSVEEQPPGLCGHLSISVDQPGMLPHPAAIKAIAEAFGIDAPIRMWLEEFDPGHRAVNLISLLP